MNMKPFTKRRIALLLAFALIAGLLPLKTPTVSKADGYGLSNPRITEGVTTWDCIWFGNYWQEDTNGDGTADKNDAKTPLSGGCFRSTAMTPFCWRIKIWMCRNIMIHILM